MGIGSNAEVRYEISQNAYIKLVLHSLRHRTATVNVGRISHRDDGVVEISDSVPLFHSNLALLPLLEISLVMEHYVARGLSIVGYFHANERFDDNERCGVAKNIGDHISRYFPQAPILSLDNKKLEALSKLKDRIPVAQLYVTDASKNWRLVGADGGSKLLLKDPSANVGLSDYISSEKWKDLVDFDDHLDDVTMDWLKINRRCSQTILLLSLIIVIHLRTT